MQRSEDELIELMNVVADGQATPEQEGELQAILRSSPEAQRKFSEVNSMVQRLGDLKRAEPPEDLKPSVMREVVSRKRQTGASVVHFRRKMVFGISWAAAAALVLVVVLFSPMREWGTGATMGPLIGKYEADGVTLTVRRKGDAILLEPRSAYFTKVSLAWDPEKLTSSEHQGQVTVTLGDATARRPQVMLQARSAATGNAQIIVSRHGREVMRAVIPLE